MERWRGILRVPLYSNSKAHYIVAASLGRSTTSKRLIPPSANVIFFNGDRVEGTGNPIIERLSDPHKIAEILVSKFGSSVNAWVIKASTFNGPFAVYRDFIPSVNSWGDPKLYTSDGFPASLSAVTLLSRCLKEANNIVAGGQEEHPQGKISESCSLLPKTILLGFSKGGTILNQLVTELAFSPDQPISICHVSISEEDRIIPVSKESFLNSISEIHYVDVGLNSKGAYITDSTIIEKISSRLKQENKVIRFFLHGTPRQWCDDRRIWIKDEKIKLKQIIESEGRVCGDRIQVYEKFYFADKLPSMQMHFEIIEEIDVT